MSDKCDGEDTPSFSAPPISPEDPGDDWRKYSLARWRRSASTWERHNLNVIGSARERLLTLAATVFGLSFLVLQKESFTAIWTIRIAWIFLLGSLIVGMASTILDRSTARNVANASTLGLYKFEISQTRETDQLYDDLLYDAQNRRRIVNRGYNVAAGLFVLGLISLMIFAWLNTQSPDITPAMPTPTPDVTPPSAIPTPG